MKRKVILTGSKLRGLVKNIITEILVKKAYSKFYSDVPEDIYNKIANVDKTRGNHLGAYAKWLLELYKQNKFNLSDINKAKGYIDVFERMKVAGKLKEVNINTFKSLDDMYNLIKDDINNQTITKGEKIRKEKDEGVERVYEDSEWTVVIPKTHKASCLYGANTKWCTASKDDPKYFKGYSKRGTLYILINKKTKRKYQFHFEDNTFMDELDNPIRTTSINIPDGLVNAITKGDIKKSLRLKYDYVGDFKGGIALVKLDDDGYNLINQNGEIISPKQWFDSVDSVENGIAVVRLNNKGYNLINKNGEMISKQWFDGARNFNEGFASVKIDGKGWNFINQSGDILFEQWFEMARNFNDGFAVVKVDNKGYNLINKNAEIISKQWFDYIFVFRSGFAVIKINNKGLNFINEKGDILLNQWFDRVTYFEGGSAKVKISDKMYEVDLNKRTINETD